MKKLLSLLLVMMLVLSLCACGGAEEEPAETTKPKETEAPAYEGLQVGFGRENILPDTMGVQIAGGDAASRLSDGYLDEVATTCIAIREGDQTILVYTIDLITVDSRVYASQSYVSGETGIPVENIILNCTHTHNGVSIRSDWDGIDQYVQKFNDACVTAAKQALEDLSPAEAYYGSTMTENMVFVRHYLMNDGTTYGNGHGSTESGYKDHAYPSDGELQVIQFAREDKKDILMMSLGAHCTMNGQQTDLMLSADYPAPAREYIENNDSDMLVAFFQGASGDQVPTSSVDTNSAAQNGYRAHGQKLAQYAIDALPTLKAVEGEGIGFANQKMTYATNKKDLDKTEGFNGRFEQKWIGIRSKLPATRDMVLRAVTVGNLGFVFAPYEMFGEQGRYIKDHSPCDVTLVATCGEGDNSYLAASKGGFEYNSYEAQVCYYAEGVAEQAAKDFVDILTVLKK